MPFTTLMCPADYSRISHISVAVFHPESCINSVAVSFGIYKTMWETKNKNWYNIKTTYGSRIAVWIIVLYNCSTIKNSYFV